MDVSSKFLCLGCLSHKDNKLFTCSYNIKNQVLRTIFQSNTLNLCYICITIVQKFEQFIQIVHRNQIYLDTYKKIPLTIEAIHNLSSISLATIELIDNNIDIEDSISVVYSAHTDSVDIKLEPKHEVTLQQLVEHSDDHDYQEISIKDEEFFLKDVKEENEQILDNINLMELKRTLKKSNPRNKTKSKKITKYSCQEKGVNKNKNDAIKMFRLTWAQVTKERMKLREDAIYKNLMYKCEDCIKGFNFKETYEKHMEIHSKVMGDWTCDICKRRTDSMEKLLKHKNCHRIRYKCSECGLTRLNRTTIRDHYTNVHLHNTFQYNCSHCNKTFNRQVSLRKHLSYVHRSQERIKCKFENCKKSFANQGGLKAHLFRKHSTEIWDNAYMNHICKECGIGFKHNSLLKNHMLKHSTKRDFYCVECDKSFKTKYALTQHLKIATPHVNYLELKLQCEHCKKRFKIKRDLEHHLNRIHLNRKPYQCDKCDKAYFKDWSLTNHKRYVHEGFKRRLKYPCSLCDKIFAQNSTLKSHIRTHTGERPYMCTQCPAQFSQSNILHTHVKLVHLQLTRDGRPKKQASTS